MPLHDWTDDRGWDSVHPFWLTYLVEWVQPRLPEGYKAFLGGVPALTVGSGNGRPDVGVRQWGPHQPTGEAATDTAVLEPDTVGITQRWPPWTPRAASRSGRRRRGEAVAPNQELHLTGAA